MTREHRLRTSAAARAACLLAMLAMLALRPAWGSGPAFDFRPPSTVADPATPAIMRDLAERLIPVYQESDPERYLANLSALQLAAGDYVSANASRQSLRERRRKDGRLQPIGRALVYDMYIRAKMIETESRLPFVQSLTKSYQEIVPSLDDQDAFAFTAWLETPPTVFREALQKAFDQQRLKDSIDQSDAVELVRTYLAFDAYRNIGPLIGALGAADEARRYSVDENVLIKTPDGASISAVVTRPTSATGPLPTLLEFTIHDVQTFARESAAHGYVGVVAFTRGVHNGSRRIVPFQHDGEDARTVIKWIAQQPWSDGRVGMYGEGYSGFTAWSAAKHASPALKAIATSASSAPGIGVPMSGNIFRNSGYRWSLQATDTDAADGSRYVDDAIWHALDQKWYASGRRYRDLGRVFGKHNPIFIRWLNHPSYDRFWQKMSPYHQDFAHIDIPVLTTTGYYADSAPSDLYYFSEHYKFNPHADHTLVIGPYDDSMMRRGPLAGLQGYQVDSAALIDLHDLRYQWFDHVLKGASAPTLLTDRVNYQVMGTNAWQHASTLEAMASGSLRYYLTGAASPLSRHLTAAKPAHPAFIRQTIKFTDRSDVDWTAPTDLVSKTVTTHNGMTFSSDPFTKPVQFNGFFSGRLDFVVNKMDMDLNISFYERLAGGDYVRLYGPAYEFRASYAKDRVHRHLLRAGERQTLVFKSERVTSRQLRAGSRLVMVLSVNKRPDREINYGMGNDVSEESLAEGKVPLRIRWYNDSYVDVPVRR